MSTRLVPRTKLWTDPEGGQVIILECECAMALDYPGHPDEHEESVCPSCGARYKVADASDIPVQS